MMLNPSKDGLVHRKTVGVYHLSRICGIGAVALSLTVCKLRRTDEGQKARNSCLRLLSSLSAGHVRFWPNRSAMLRRCLSRCLVSVD